MQNNCVNNETGRELLPEILPELQVLSHSFVTIACPSKGNALGGGTDPVVVCFDPFELPRAQATGLSCPTADIICLTHDHYDHFSPESLSKILGPQTFVVAPSSVLRNPQTARELARLKVDTFRQIALNPGETRHISGVTLGAVPAYNPRKKFHPRANGWVGYVLQANKTRYFVTGDTDANPENARVACDVVCLPVGGTYTFDPAEAAVFVAGLPGVAFAVPTHYGTAVGNRGDGARFAEALGAQVGERVRVVEKLRF